MVQLPGVKMAVIDCRRNGGRGIAVPDAGYRLDAMIGKPVCLLMQFMIQVVMWKAAESAERKLRKPILAMQKVIVRRQKATPADATLSCSLQMRGRPRGCTPGADIFCI